MDRARHILNMLGLAALGLFFGWSFYVAAGLSGREAAPGLVVAVTAGAVILGGLAAVLMALAVRGGGEPD